MGAPQPKTIGRYDVERMLGQGGMGRVWLARDTVLGRRVAVKVLRDDLALPPRVRDELFVRMEHEARAAAAVSHPNIVTLHDMGEDDKLGLFLVFEYVASKEGDEKHSLRERLAQGPLPFAEVARLARELGSALSFAHEAGVIHRDVKPENVLFSRTGFKIADFGIARIPESTITRANTVLGTPAYTAPEALGDGAFGPASDQFALAATLYEAACARRAFSAADAITTAGKVTNDPPPPLTSIIGNEAAVVALDAAIQRGLAKAPGDRFASCAELGEEVARILENAAPPARVGRVLSLPTPSPAILELERTPLSSRATVRKQIEPANAALATDSGGFDTNRPSIVARRQTQRFQNVAAAIAVIVILVLVLMGRRNAPPPENATGVIGSDSAVLGSAPAPTPAPKPHPTAKPKPSAVPKPAPADAGPSVEEE
ncbi:MAG: serine/threonine protein kinase [Labilithrix sp.]|nr:serine/threonine protein kinase [Labilithrix sp.]MCW5814645.1 serine/threonine protein kinase [Labilithrix sp.]